MTSYVPPKKNAAFIFYVALVSQADTKLLQANPTLASGDVKVSIDGAAFANLGTLPAVTPASGRAVKVTMANTEMNGDNIFVQFVDASGAEWCDATFSFQTAAQTDDETATAIGVIDDFLDTEVAAIKAKTDNLPSDPADASDIASSFTTVNTKLDTIDDFLDTEIAAIKAKTDNLPATPAATGDAMTLTSGERTSVADALLNRDMSVGTDSGSTTVRTVRQALRLLRNRWVSSGGTLTSYKEDDATPSWTAVLTGDAAATPVIESNPAGP